MPTLRAPRLDRNTLADEVATAILRSTAEAGLARGAPLPPVIELASRFAVSPLIVREALTKLASREVIARGVGRTWVLLRARRPTANGHHSTKSAAAPHVALQYRSLADRASAAILNLIQDEKLKVGDALPPAGELADRFGVSAVVIREAIASLAAREVLKRRQGRDTVISLPSTEIIGSIFRIRMYLEDIHPNEFQVLREILETKAAELAARNSTRGSAQENFQSQLRGMRESSNNDDYSEFDFRFHMAVAHHSGNRPIQMLIAATNELVWESLRESNARVVRKSGRRGLEVGIRNHSRIAHAILAGDEDAASAAMRRHFAYAHLAAAGSDG